MQIIIALVSGLIFGIGLLLSGMTNPGKVLGFLDIVGRWDASLIFVMVGAIGTAFIPFTLAKRRTQSLLGLPMQLPTSRVIDRRLVIGSALFGIGWGIAGICPGPALVLLGSGYWEGVIFVAAMLGGMMVFEWMERQHGN